MAFDVSHLLTVGHAKEIYSNLKSAIADLTDEVEGDVSHNYTIGKNLRANSQSYNIIDDENGCISDFIPVTWEFTTSDKVIFFYNDTSGNVYQIWFYDENQDPIDYYGIESGKPRRAVKYTANTAYIRFSFKKGTVGQLASYTPPTVQYWLATDTVDEAGIAQNLDAVTGEVDEMFDVVSEITRRSQNLFDPDGFTDGYYMNNNGTANSNSTYGYTDYISVVPGDTLYWNCGDARYVCAYDVNKFAVDTSGASSSVSSGNYTVPAGIYYVILTFTMANIPQNPVVNIGTALISYEPYQKVYIKDSAIKSIPVEKVDGLDLGQIDVVLGSEAVFAESASLASGVTLALDSAPRFIKKNVGVSAVMSFESFTSVTVGKGYNTYRGKWIVIDSTNITPYSYEESAVAGTPVAHGLTISDYLQLSMFLTDDGVCHINVNTTSGTFQTTIDYNYEWNYAPFVFGAQAMTDVKLGYSCGDLRSPLWVFGDSYLGFGSSRVGGQLKNAGFIGYCINSIAGARSVDSGTPNKSSYDDLQRMLAFATPKFIVWGDGMNGGDQSNINFIPTLLELCEEKGIELILYLPPSVPTINHDTLNTYIKSLDVRYVDGNAAVGATSQGVWYTGYLSSDEVHPTELGAKAIAMRYLCDAPELMQYGYYAT